MANETSNQKNLPGLYRHPESGATITVEHDPITGSAIADGLVRVGYVRVGDAAAEQKAIGETESTGAPEKSGKPLSEYKVKELVEIAREVGVEDLERFSAVGTKKQDIIDAIEAAQEAKDNE